MFDGSHRTNKREINLAGASSSARSSRRAHLNQARHKRLERAEAKARLNSSRCLQKCWRGSHGRRVIAIELSRQYESMLDSLSSSNGGVDVGGSPTQQKISRAASLLAFRLSPALLPFYACRSTTSTASNKKKWGEEDEIAESCMRKDLLLLEHTIRQQHPQTVKITPMSSKKIISITLILLRQSISHIASNTIDNQEKVNGENQCLVHLLDQFLLENSFSSNVAAGNILTDKPSDYYMNILRKKDTDGSASSVPGWMINLFLCFRDHSLLSCSNHNTGAGDSLSMDVDGSSDGSTDTKGDIDQHLLKWCCQSILYLASLDVKHTQMQQSSESGTIPLMYQQGLALLASILFASSTSEGKPLVMNEQLTSCLMKLEQYTRGTGNSATVNDLPTFFLLTHYLATSMNALTSYPNNAKVANNRGRKLPGVMLSLFSSSCTSGTAAPFLGALSDTLSTREFIILDQVLSHGITVQSQTQQTEELFTFAIPTILQYTLQHQHDLAILASFAAQGQNISSWFSESITGTGDTSIATTTAAAAAFEEEEVDDESDDDDGQDAPAQPQQQQRSARDISTTSTGRYSRTDLQTLPKLDVMYQNSILRAKKVTVDRLRSFMSSHGKQVSILIALAEKIGKGEWIQQLGTALFSTTQTQSLTPLTSLMAPLSLSSWRGKAQVAYTSVLAAIMVSCSGIKAGRNATSPLLSKLAFNESFLHGMWSRCNVPVLVSQSKTMDTTVVASACEVFSSFCDTFSHQLLAVDDDDFLKRHYQSDDSKLSGQEGRLNAKDIVLCLKTVLNDLYWIRPVLASDITNAGGQNSDPESQLRFQRARVLLAGTKLFNSLYERWCRLYRVAQFCSEDCWWLPHLATRGQHDNNPIIQSQVTTFGDQNDDDVDDSSVESVHMMDDDEAVPVSANDVGGDALATAFRDPKMARVLTYIPQSMPFSRRVHLFNSLLESDKSQTQDETASFRQMMMNFEDGEEAEMSSRERVTIRRDALYSDSKQRLNSLGQRLRKRVQVTFVNKHGQEEAGIDGGGVFKEFLDDLIKEGIVPNTEKENGDAGDDDDDSVVETHPDFFVVTPLQTLKVNTALDGNDSMLSHYEFLGRVLGKAIYESILVEPQFCLPFLNKLLGKQNSLDDLKNLDPEYYKNLKSLRHMNGQEIKDLALSFELHDSATVTIDLLPGGSKIPVTQDNVIQYIHLVSHQKMNLQGSRQTAAFLRGFRDIVPAQWVRLFSAYELQKLISGDDAVKGIDVQGMMNVMRYSGGLHPSQPVVHWLWEVVDEMTPEQQRKFLKFMSSCSRQPLLGFASMVPAPCIQQTRLREDDYGRDIAEGSSIGNVRLPSSSTCMNLLKLPKYTSKEMLRQKLLYAIESAAGFELS